MSDSVTTALTKALAPKPGLQRIPFPTESYQHPSLPLNHKRLVNYYAEAEPPDSRSAAALIPTPGLLVSTDYIFGAGPVFAMNGDLNGLIYAVSGDKFYRAGRPYGSPIIVVEELGTVGLAGGADYSINLMPTIAVGVTAAVVVVPPNAYTCTHYGPINQIGGDFPGARSVTYLDGYFVFTNDQITAQFFVSGLLDPNAYDALDFAYADGVPNIIRRAMTLRGDIWFLGDNALEVWYDSGDTDFPLRRRTGGVIPHGLATVHSAALCDGSIFWLGIEGIVFRSEGYQAKRVSTHSIEAIIRGLGDSAVSSSLSYVQDGHAFYVITIGTRTLVYDCATTLWHERSSSTDGNSAWLPMSSAQAGEFVLLGSSTSGRSFQPRPGTDLDDYVQTYRSMITPPIWAGTNRAYMNRIELEMEVGGEVPTESMLMEISDDGGRTWKPGRTLAVGDTGATTTRVVSTRLGSFRQRMFRFTAFGGAATLYALDADISSFGLGG